MTRRTHWTDAQKQKAGDRYPKTRAELLYYLWYALDMHHINIFKEGAEYTVRIGKTIHATYLRTIDSLTCSQWADRCRAQYFPF